MSTTYAPQAFRAEFHCDAPGCTEAFVGEEHKTKEWARYYTWRAAKKAGWRRKWLPRYSVSAKFYDLCEQCVRTWRPTEDGVS